MCTVPFTVYTFWRKPPLLNSRHIETILLFMGIKFLQIKNLDLGKFFSLPMGINFFLLRKADKQCFLFVYRTIIIFFMMPKRWQASMSLSLILTSMSYVHYSLCKVFTTNDIRDTRNFNIVSTAIISNFLIYLPVLQFY